jgi:hypothetical protein
VLNGGFGTDVIDCGPGNDRARRDEGERVIDCEVVTS